MSKIILKKERALKYIAIMDKWDKKTMYTRELSNQSGVIEDVIAEELAVFDSLIRLFPDYNLLLILPEMKKKFTTRKIKNPPTVKKVQGYDGVGDFIYQHMTIPGGILDKNIILTKKQLQLLKKIINEELKKQ